MDTKLSNRQGQGQYSEYWQKRVAEIKKADTFYDKDKRQLMKDVIDVTHGKGPVVSADRYIFWIDPTGKVTEAPEGHQEKPLHMMSETDWEGYEQKDWLRGRMSTLPDGKQVILLYVDVTDMLGVKRKLHQLNRGLSNFAVPVYGDAVIVVNGDILGTVSDLEYGQLG